MKRHAAWPHLLMLCTICISSCVDADRSNPLDSTLTPSVEGLFIPKIMNPSGGEQWFIGTTQEIRWQSASQISDSLVTLQLVCGSNPSDIVDIADSIPNTGRLTWEVPDHPSPDCRIRITGRAGISESPLPFKIKPLPILERLDINGDGREPAAIRDLVVFTSTRAGDEDLFLYNRTTRTLQRLTSHVGFDGEASLIKPNGKAIAFTSDRGGQKNIWGMALQGAQAFAPFQITTTGGEQPAWQNAEHTANPSIVYKQVTIPVFRLRALTIDVPTATVPIFNPPITYRIPPQTFVTAVSEFSISTIKKVGAPSWGFSEAAGQDILVFDTGDTPSQIYKVDIAILDTTFVIGGVPTLNVFQNLSVTHPSVSLNADRVTFSANGDIWIVSVNGGAPIQVTFGEDLDDFPDWASETEIVFQRQPPEDVPPEIWAVQAPDF